ncbi:MAG TPA: hypothetical protein VK824_09035 [Planctomycetota bacterium]|nr:hypothetical protein [Planctomycetota bacterium]
MSTGHVFHPGHDEWHGQTVVIFTKGPLTVVGRWHDISGDRLHMHDVALHEAGRVEETREAWLARLQQYGIPSEHKDYALPAAEIERVTRLRDI